MNDQIFKQKILTPAVRKAHKVFREIEREAALTDYAKAEKALHENRERLKAERLAREAAELKTKGK
jgi:hypothetical protein